MLFAVKTTAALLAIVLILRFLGKLYNNSIVLLHKLCKFLSATELASLGKLPVQKPEQWVRIRFSRVVPTETRRGFLSARSSGAARLRFGQEPPLFSDEKSVTTYDEMMS
jgi:hypothetical protein